MTTLGSGTIGAMYSAEGLGNAQPSALVVPAALSPTPMMLRRSIPAVARLAAEAFAAANASALVPGSVGSPSVEMSMTRLMVSFGHEPPAAVVPQPSVDRATSMHDDVLVFPPVLTSALIAFVKSVSACALSMIFGPSTRLPLAVADGVGPGNSTIDRRTVPFTFAASALASPSAVPFTSVLHSVALMLPLASMQSARSSATLFTAGSAVLTVRNVQAMSPVPSEPLPPPVNDTVRAVRSTTGLLREPVHAAEASIQAPPAGNADNVMTVAALLLIVRVVPAASTPSATVVTVVFV